MPIVIAACTIAAAALAERLHHDRVARVSRLAFGELGRPARWARMAPAARVLAATAVAWGAATLLSFDPVQRDRRPNREASKHVLVCLDVSPSMMLKDAGPDPEKVSRGAWAGKVVQGILDRLDTETTRLTLVAFYTDALPIVRETFEKPVIANALDGLPMYVAFTPGPTDMKKGLEKSFEFARIWKRNTGMLVVISDGDAHAVDSMLHVPDSIADVLVIGVGDPHKSTVINGHPSKQDTDSLRHLAASMGGVYHDGNVKHLPSALLNNLTLTSPRSSEGLSRRDAALASIGVGGAVLALIGPALILFGRPGMFEKARRSVARRAQIQGNQALPAAEGTP